MNQLPIYEYVEESFAVYVPAAAQGWDFWLQRADDGVLTQRSLLPVSRCIRTVCGGVPKEPFTKYRVSCSRVSDRNKSFLG